MGFDVPAASPNDMVVALRVHDDDALDRGLAAVDRSLAAAVRRPVRRHRRRRARTAPHLGDRPALGRPAGWSWSRRPGASATVEAMDALDAGADVMLFSDNVPVEQEIALKRVAADRGLLVMGPDCGTAVVGGLGLGFANVVQPGPVGIVAASGTGCQQLLSLLDHAGVGVTSALGVGGRDLSAEVGGLATREALRRLDVDETVELIVLVSKPPAPEVAAAIEAYVASLGTPVELALLGPGRPDLTAAAEAVLGAWGATCRPGRSASRGPPTSAGPGDGCTGSSSAAPTAPRRGSSPRSCWGPTGGHTFTDFGDDAYTAGRAHPMIDPTLRLEHLARGGRPRRHRRAAARRGARPRRRARPVRPAGAGHRAGAAAGRRRLGRHRPRPAGPRPPGPRSSPAPAPRSTCPTPAPPGAPSSCCGGGA